MCHDHGLFFHRGDVMSSRLECLRHILGGHCYDDEYAVFSSCYLFTHGVPDCQQLRLALLDGMLVNEMSLDSLKCVCMSLGLSATDVARCYNTVDKLKSFLECWRDGFSTYFDLSQLMVSVQNLANDRLLTALRVHGLDIDGDLDAKKMRLALHVMMSDCRLPSLFATDCLPSCEKMSDLSYQNRRQ